MGQKEIIALFLPNPTKGLKVKDIHLLHPISLSNLYPQLNKLCRDGTLERIGSKEGKSNLISYTYFLNKDYLNKKVKCWKEVKK